MDLREKLSNLLRDTYNELKNKPHKNPYTYSIGGNLRAYVGDNLELNNNSIIIGGVYGFECVKNLHDKMFDTIKSYLPKATLFEHNRAPYPQEDMWEEFSIDGKLTISLQWKYGHCFSVVSFE